MSRAEKIATLQYAAKQLSLSQLDSVLQQVSPTTVPEVEPALTTYAPDLLYFALLLSEPALTEWTSQYFPSHLDPDKLVAQLQPHVQTTISLAQKVQSFVHLPRKIEAIIQEYRPPRKSIRHISPTVYQHPEEKELLEQMGDPPFESLARTLSEQVSERAFDIRNHGNAILVSETQLPELHHRFSSLCSILGVSPVPKLFVAKGSINAYTSGTESPFVVIHDSVLELPSAEVDFILGHELGHIAFDHMLLQMIAQASALQTLLVAPTMLLSRVLGYKLQQNIRKWVRKAELSCDRAGLLTCQDPESAIRVMLRFAGTPKNLLDKVNLEELLQQNEKVATGSDGFLGRLLQDGNRTHPWIVQRIKALHSWVEAGEYDTILNTPTPEFSRSTAVHDLSAFSVDEMASFIRQEIQSIQSEYRAEFKTSSLVNRRYEQRSRLESRVQSLAHSVENATSSSTQTATLSLHRRAQLQGSSAIGEAASITLGVFLFPAAPLWMSAIGVGIGISSWRDAKQEQRKRRKELLWEHFEEVDLWLCECEERLLASLEE